MFAKKYTPSGLQSHRSFSVADPTHCVQCKLPGGERTVVAFGASISKETLDSKPLQTPLWRRASLVAWMVKNLPTMWQTQVRSLGQEDPLEKGTATHSSILAWEIPWTDSGCQREQTAGVGWALEGTIVPLRQAPCQGLQWWVIKYLIFLWFSVGCSNNSAFKKLSRVGK